MDIGRVIVPERLTRPGETLLAFAGDLAERLGRPCLRIPGANADALRRFDYARGDILVAPHPVRRDVTTLVPFDESGLLARGIPPRALIPLSNGESGTSAAVGGLPMLASLGFEVLFWHTTWRDSANPSTDAHDHLASDSRAAIAEAESLARDAGVRFRTVVATSDSMQYGLALVALTEECALIVMARGLDAVRGSYVDSMLECSSVPLLLIGRPLIGRTERSAP